MIKERNSLSLAESLEFISEEENTEVKGFIKKFVEIDGKKAKDLREKLVSMEIIKLREEHISKLIDLLPKNKEEINKVFIDVSLEENEIESLLNTIKEFA
jgi:DNA-directed RNA polymerase subunit F